MNAFIFVSVICISQQCTFLSSNKPITEAYCQDSKKQFLSLPFKPEVTLAVAQCMEFESDRKWL